MDSGIEIFWPNYKVGTRQNFSTRQRIKKNLTLTLAQWDLKATLKFSQNHDLPWSGVFEEFAVLDFVAWPERWNILYKRWTRQPLTLTDVLYGSDICMDKWTINNVNNTYNKRICSSAGSKNQQCFDSSFNTESLFVSIDMHEDMSRQDVCANPCIHISLRNIQEKTVSGCYRCLPVDPSAGVCEVLLQDAPQRQWD